MAINSIIFGGVNSADYGIYIGGEGTFNAPKRDVEMVDIPGRNGAVAIDNGRFENIEVTYSAFNHEPNDYATFAQNLSDFRNAICSLKGYQRLTDSFHPGEYRMAVYKEGLEVNPVKYNTASEFDLVFDCKPQRWLVSGETAETVTSGGTLTNPTLFDSEPLLAVKGYGVIAFNGYSINLDDALLGPTDPATGISYPDGTSFVIGLNSALYRSGDAIALSDLTTPSWGSTIPGLPFNFRYNSGGAALVLTAALVSHTESGAVTSASWGLASGISYRYAQLSAVFTAGTSSTGTTSAVYNVNNSGGSVAGQMTVTVTAQYDAVAEAITVSFSYSSAIQDTRYECGTFLAEKQTTASVVVDSTETYLGDPTYIDCDLGECYKEAGGEVISLNRYIDLGSDLPKLAPGTNTFTLDNTITELKVSPRWWRV